MSLDILFHQAKNAYESRDFIKAIQIYSEIIEIDNQNVEAYYQRCLSYYHLNDKHKALEDAEKCVTLEPDNPFRYSCRAYIKESLGQTRDAINDYKKAIKLDPEDAVAYNNLGLLEEKLGYEKMAEQHFKKADELGEKHFPVNEQEKQKAREVREKLNGHSRSQSPQSEEEKIKQYIQSLGGDVKIEVINDSFWDVIRKTFTDKKYFKEFLDFVKNGLKLPKK